jgi:hypothetical protein
MPDTETIEAIRRKLSKISDPQTQSTDDNKFDLNKSLKEFQLQELQDSHKLRKKYCDRIFWLVTVWIALILLILFLSGFQIYKFKLDSSVLITISTTTTISVLGLFAIVAKWLFPK